MLLHNPHPGEILFSEFLEPMGLSQNALAKAIGVSARRVNEIVLGRRGVTAETSLLLGKFFGMSESFWLGLQKDYELMEAKRKLGDRLEAVRRHAA